MAVNVSTIAVRDGNNNAVTNGVSIVDTAGADAGPFTTAHVQLDATGLAIAAFGTGARAATVQRVTVATDDIQVTDANLTAVSVANVDSWTSRLLSGALQVGGGAAGTTGQAVGGSYRVTPYTLTDTQMGELQLTAAGNLLVSVATLSGVVPAFGEGVVGATVQRVSLATDDDAVANINAMNAKFVSGTDIGDVDVTSIVPGTAATNLGKAVDSARGATATGVLGLHVVDAALTAITPVDDDYAESRVDANGALWVHAVDGDAQVVLGTGTYTQGTSEGVIMGVVRNDALAALANTDNEVAPLQVNALGALYVDISAQPLAAGTAHVGEIGGNTVVKSVSMTANNSIMDAADVIADTQQIDAAFRVADGTGVLQSLTVFDYDDNTAFAFDVYIHSTSNSMGNENGAISITDANAYAGIIGVVSFAATDVKDLIASKMYTKSNIGLPIYAASGTDDLYISIVNGSGTPTFGGGAIPVRLGILRD